MRHPRHLALATVLLLTATACSGPPDRFSEADVDLLTPGYARVHARMEQFGCTNCHTTGPQKIQNHFRPPSPDVDPREGTRMLLARIDQPDLDQARLVRKPSAQLPHKGGLILDAARRAEWLNTLREWLAPLEQQEGA